MQKEPRDLFPFQERVDVGLFFSGARRRKLLDNVKNAVFEAVPVITITGDEGTGKTMICRMVEKELPAEYSCVYLPTTLESFDDVVRILALGLGTENSEKPGSTKALVKEILQHLEDNGRQLVAIFDQSERMYLATLERIRRMLDQINSNKVLFQIILAGRKVLLENLKQLAICDFKSVEERGFVLEYLGLSETYAYLNHCVQSRSPARGKNVFSPEASKKIYSMAQGNFRMTNMLAEKSLESFDSETSFMVLLENVHDEGNGAVAQKDEKRKVFRSTSDRKHWIISAIGLLLMIVTTVYFVIGDKKDEPSLADKKSLSETVAVTVKKGTADEPLPKKITSAENLPAKEKKRTGEGQKKLPQPKQAKKSTEKKVAQQTRDEVPVRNPEIQQEQNTDEIDGASPQHDNRADKLAVQTDITDDGNSEDKKVDEPVEIVSEDIAKETSPGRPSPPQTAEPSKVVTQPIKIEQKKVELPDTQIAVIDNDTSSAEVPVASEQNIKKEVEFLTLSDGKKRKPSLLQSGIGAKKLIQIAPVTVEMTDVEAVDQNKKLAAVRTEEQLYQQRVDAASSWHTGSNNDKYTVQLMMLTSEQAEENLIKRFEQEEYREISDSLYIIRGKDDSSVFVYYGEYPDQDSARKVRNTLPIFLRKHNPYVISVENAVQKASSP